MTNPFLWPGPAFLAAYTGLGVAVIVATVVVRRFAEGGIPPVMVMNDAAWMACLREGPAEAVRITLASLVDRGLVCTDDNGWFSAAEDRQGFARRPLERAVLAAVTVPAAIDTILAHPEVQAAAAAYERQLASLGLLAGATVKAQRRWRRGTAMCLLLGVAAIKLNVALSTGHRNVGFLIVLACLFGVILGLGGRSRRTVRGDAMLADIRTLFSGLRQRSGTLKSGGASADVALLAAVYGLAAVPAAVLPARALVDPRIQAKSSLSGGSGAGDGGHSTWGSSCSSSGGSSCSGSSCGGGGCGGCGG